VLTDRPETRFAVGNVLHLEGDSRPLTVVAGRPVEDGPGWRVHFREIADRAAAEPLRDAYLEVSIDRSSDLAAGAAYWHEVIGATVRDSNGAVLGKVADVYRAGETEVYVVRDGPAGEFDLPAVRDVITTFAPERGELVVDEAVLDLAAPAIDSPGAAAARPPHRRPRWSRHGKGGASNARAANRDASGRNASGRDESRPDGSDPRGPSGSSGPPA
jgi:16S rRNA processing protein RimM